MKLHIPMKIANAVFLFIAWIFFSYTAEAQFELLKVPYRCGKLWGYSDTTGKVLITPVYDSVECFSLNGYLKKDIAYVYKNGKTGIIDEEGNVVIPVVWDSLHTLYTQGKNVNALIVKKGKSFGAINFQADIIIPAKYDALKLHDFNSVKNNFFYFEKAEFLARRGNTYYTIDLQGKPTVVTEKFYKDNIRIGYGVAYYPFHDRDSDIPQLDFASFVQKNKSMIDSISTTQFQKRSQYYVIYKNNKLGLVHQNSIRDNKPENIIRPVFDEVIDVEYEFSEGLATHFLVRINGYITVIDTSGNVLMPLKYKDYSRWNPSFVYTIENGKEGYYNLETGYELLPEYEEVYRYGDKFRIWKVKQNGVWTYMTNQKRPYVCE